MIWFWIVAAVAISWLLCRKKVRWIHYIWILLPIEMYGISVAGATIKPYMIFGAFIVLDNLMKRRKMVIPQAIVLVTLFLILSDCLTGLITASIMQHLMFLLIVFIACNYLIAQKDGIYLEEIEEAALAATIGYGLVFTVASLLYSLNINIDGIYTTNRYTTGMLLRLFTTGGVSEVRLRGFCIDPNSVVTTLIPGASFAIANLMYRRKEMGKSLCAMLLYFFVVCYSKSRMGLICSIIMVVIMFAIGFKASKRKRKLLTTAGVFALMLVLVLIGDSIVNQKSIASEIGREFMQFISSRSSLNDENGRLTIWKTNISYLIENNCWIFGVGQNQIATLTLLGKACHSTWLEWICGTGIFLGMFVNLWFILAPFKYYRKIRDLGDDLCWGGFPLLLAYIIVVLCITTIDNVTNSVLLFLMLIFRYGRNMKV